MDMKYLMAACLAVSNAAAAASDIDQLQNIGQAQFRLLSEDLGAALSYKALIPAEPLGITGFDVGIEITATDLDHAEALEQATSGDAPTVLPIPKLHVHKGLPFGIDLGVSYAAVPDSNIELWGAEARYAILKGGVAMPALALRGSYSRLAGVDQLDFETTGVDVSVSKGFAFLTPYAGLGRVWVSSTPDGVPGLAEEKFSMAKYFAGLDLNFALLNLAVEVDKTGDAMSYGAKVGLRF